MYDYGDDVEGVFLHELGHAAIGLNHPRWAGSKPDQRVMYVGDFDTSPVGFELTHLDADGQNPTLIADLWPGKTSSVPRGLVRFGDRQCARR